MARAPVDYCEQTGKVCFDKHAARTAANHRYAEDHTELRIYQCQYGDHWHLTKQMRRDGKWPQQHRRHNDRRHRKRSRR